MAYNNGDITNSWRIELIEVNYILDRPGYIEDSMHDLPCLTTSQFVIEWLGIFSMDAVSKKYEMTEDNQHNNAKWWNENVLLGHPILAAAFLFSFLGCSQKPQISPPEYSIDLQEGFSGEVVQVLIDDKSVYGGKPQTNELLGVADRFVFDSESTTITLTVVVPAKNVNSTHSLDLSRAKCIGISIRNGDVEVIQANGFGYD